MSHTPVCAPVNPPRAVSRWERLHRSLNHDFCPWANRWVYWLKNPFWILVLATISAALCALCLSPNAWVIAIALGSVLIAGSLWPWIAMRGVECELEFLRPRIQQGETVLARLTLKNRCPWPVWGLSIERGFQTAGADGDSVALARLKGWSEQEYLWEFRPAARGVYPTVPPRIESAFPFGLVSCRQPLSACNELIVWPQTVVLESLPDVAEFEQHGERCSDRRAGDFGEILGTRPFRAGDSLRRVHWAQTARLGTTIVTERQAPHRSAVVVMAELRRAHHFRSDRGDTLELTLSLMASLCESLSAQHCFVECILAGRRYVPGHSARDRTQFLDALARIPKGGLDDSDGERFPPVNLRRGARHIEIRTTASGRHRTGPAQDCRSIIIGDDGEARKNRAWIALSAEDSALDQIPRLWRRACRDH